MMTLEQMQQADRERARTYYWQHRDEILAKRKANYIPHPRPVTDPEVIRERKNAYRRECYRTNKDGYRDIKAYGYRKNREERKRQAREYYYAHRAERLAYAREYYASGRKKRYEKRGPGDSQDG